MQPMQNTLNKINKYKLEQVWLSRMSTWRYEFKSVNSETKFLERRISNSYSFSSAAMTTFFNTWYLIGLPCFNIACFLLSLRDEVERFLIFFRARLWKKSSKYNQTLHTHYPGSETCTLFVTTTTLCFVKFVQSHFCIICLFTVQACVVDISRNKGHANIWHCRQHHI